MKTLEQILKQEPVFLNDWKSKFEVIKDFEDVYMTEEEYLATESPYSNVKCWLDNKDRMDKAIEKYKPINILFASYGCACYEGDAWVLFEQDDKLFEVNGSHCSCYGLEGQFEPEEVSLEVLEFRLKEGRLGENDYCDNRFKDELCEFLGVELVKEYLN